MLVSDPIINRLKNAVEAFSALSPISVPLMMT